MPATVAPVVFESAPAVVTPGMLPDRTAYRARVARFYPRAEPLDDSPISLPARLGWMVIGSPLALLVLPSVLAFAITYAFRKTYVMRRIDRAYR